MLKWLNSNLVLNASIAFLSVLLLALLFGLYLRVSGASTPAERTEASSTFISSIIQIEVLNGCGEPGVATTFTNKLRSSGFDVVESGNFESFDVQETVVIDRSGNLQNARKVADALGISRDKILREVSPDFYLDATVVIGHDFSQLLNN